jgi:hypothetical protein
MRLWTHELISPFTSEHCSSRIVGRGLHVSSLLVPACVTTTTTSNPACLRSATRVNVIDSASSSVGQVAKVSPSCATDHRPCLVRVTTEGILIGPAASVSEVRQLIKEGVALDAALLDINLSDGPVTPVLEALSARGIPLWSTQAAWFLTTFACAIPSWSRFPSPYCPRA